MPAKLLSLPPELILDIAEHMTAEALHCLILCNRYLHSLLNARLYELWSRIGARKAIFYEDVMLLQHLLSRGGRRLERNTLLKSAVVYSNVAATQVLLEAGADPRAEPLLLFYPMLNQNWDILTLLLKYGADPNQAHALEENDDWLYTPRQVAWVHGTPRIRKMLDEAIAEGRKCRNA